MRGNRKVRKVDLIQKKKSARSYLTCEVAIANCFNFEDLASLCNRIEGTVNLFKELEHFNRTARGTPSRKSSNVGKPGETSGKEVKNLR